MEQPNLIYIDSLSGDDFEFKAKLIATLKRELPLEVENYNESANNRNFFEMAAIVHKLKHKISILGMEKSYYLAEEFEDNLKKQSAVLKPEFDEVIASLQDFTASL
ncbi:Hpt domain-containing protein [Flavobacterium sp. MFBS3-15]|uniref:Hpt domain-containing protein n=1 Tax=Flavobacterium sp. MFBS3-15 TaxID=2989816 RepID=UPI002236B7F7|nr:Hpt domain-containing protein [Flavobacterium sp. MFBS3-15]MCW4470820.1 Hpt domain-containing protein [Flavobacterium sp. MFBS3-15]